MPIPGKKSATAESTKLSWRPWLRAFHRDVGYLLVGLTFVYAASGLAVNHIADWNPNFVDFDRRHELGAGLPRDDEGATRAVLARLAIDERPREIYRASDSELELLFADRTVEVDLDSGVAHDRGQKPRLLLRVANWLHLNRGKKAWTYVADGYAGLLLFLACSGLFMLPGRKGLFGRGAVLALCGAAIPVLYVVLSGGP